MSLAALKKVLGSDPSNSASFLLAFPADLLFTKKMSKDAQGRTEYIGYALPGTLVSQPKWCIKKLTWDSDGFLTDEGFADGIGFTDDNWSSVWNDRETEYTYS